MFENPVANQNPFDSFAKGSEIANRKQLLQQQQQTFDLEQQKLQQQQAIMKIGQEAARSGDPRAVSMYSALNPEGGKALRENIKYFADHGNAELQSIRDAKITDRPAVYKMKMASLKNNPYFDTSNYPDEYDPGLVDKMLEADIASGRDMSKSYELKDTDAGLMRFDPSTGATSQTGIQSSENSGKKFTNTTAIRNDFLQTTKPFQTVREAYERVEASAEDPSAAGDLALIFGYMKTLDPGSTVREGEFANAQNAGSAFQKVGSVYNRVLNGERLTEKQRADFRDRAKRLYGQAEKSHEKTVSQYRRIAERNKLNPDDVTIDFKTTVPKKPEITPIPDEFKTATLDVLLAERAKRQGGK